MCPMLKPSFASFSFPNYILRSLTMYWNDTHCFCVSKIWRIRWEGKFQDIYIYRVTKYLAFYQTQGICFPERFLRRCKLGIKIRGDFLRFVVNFQCKDKCISAGGTYQKRERTFTGQRKIGTIISTHYTVTMGRNLEIFFLFVDAEVLNPTSSKFRAKCPSKISILPCPSWIIICAKHVYTWCTIITDG